MFSRVFSRSLILFFFVSISINASAFEWRLNDMWICGDTPFTTCDDFPALDPLFDDFEDGDFDFGVGSEEFGVGLPDDSTLLTMASGVFTC